MTVALLAGIAGRMYLDLLDFAQDRVVEVGASYKPYAAVASMTRDADLVVLGRVVGEGKTHYVAQPVEQPRAFQPPADTERLTSAEKQNLATAPVESHPNVATSAQFDLPVTAFTLSVERVVRGTARDSALTMTQPGGTLRTPTFPGGPQITRTVEFEHDPAMKPGERHLLFLRDAGDGTYYVVGGPHGRLRIDQGQQAHPIDRAAPAVRGRDGERVESLLSEVAAVR
jgi:hypothetical protein